MEKIKVLFVCMGNICRSPTAEGVFAKILKENGLEDFFTLDSAGTHAYHIGEAPDIRAQKAALNRGVEIHQLRARKVADTDFSRFDYLLAMDEENRQNLINSCPASYQHKIRCFLDYAPHLKTRIVPDPYYGGRYGFERVLDLLEEASLGFLKHLGQTQHIPEFMALRN